MVTRLLPTAESHKARPSSEAGPGLGRGQDALEQQSMLGNISVESFCSSMTSLYVLRLPERRDAAESVEEISLQIHHQLDSLEVIQHQLNLILSAI